MAKKTLNPNQAKFVKNVLDGKSRAEAYMDAYGYDKTDPNANDNARKCACRLLATNADVKAKIDDALDAQVERARERLKEESDNTIERLLLLRDMGNKDVSVQLGACKDILDRIGLKPTEKHEHTGGLNLVQQILGND